MKSLFFGGHFFEVFFGQVLGFGQNSLSPPKFACSYTCGSNHCKVTKAEPNLLIFKPLTPVRWFLFGLQGLPLTVYHTIRRINTIVNDLLIQLLTAGEII